MKVALVSLIMLVMVGCVSTDVKFKDGLKITTAGETNMFRPSLSVMEVARCVETEGRTETNVVDGEEQVCYGYYYPVAIVQGTQAGAMTGLGSAAIQGGAIVGGAYLIGDGIRDSADKTTNNVSQEGGGGVGVGLGGSSSSSSVSGAKAISRSNSSSVSKNYNRNYNRNTNTNNPMPMGGMD